LVVKLKASSGKHLRHVTHVGLMNGHTAPQVAFILGRLLGQNVTLESLTAFNGAPWANSKALFSAAFCFHFGHLLLLFECAREAFAKLNATLLAPRHLLFA
jgi:hypothetical protein